MIQLIALLLLVSSSYNNSSLRAMEKSDLTELAQKKLKITTERVIIKFGDKQYYKPTEDTLTFYVPNTQPPQEYVLPRLIALRAQTIKHWLTEFNLKDEYRVEFSFDIQPTIMELVAQLMWLFEKYEMQSGKELFQSIQLQMQGRSFNTMYTLFKQNVYQLLKTFNYLDFKTGLQFIAYYISYRPELLEKMNTELAGLPELKNEIARYHYLRRGHNLPNFWSDNFGFTIQELVDYKPKDFETRIKDFSASAILNLSWLKINDLHGIDDIPKIESATELNLDHNRLQELPSDLLESLPNLKTLDVAYNTLQRLPANLSENERTLESLDLSFNKIRELPIDFLKHIHGLQYLYLNNNLIRSIPENFFPRESNLYQLNISYNQIQHIPIKVLENNKPSITILTGNPLEVKNKKELQELLKHKTLKIE